MAVNKCGVLEDYEDILFVAKTIPERGFAEVSAGEHEGLWYGSSSLSLSQSGYGSAPSISDRHYKPRSFTSKQSCIDYYTAEVKAYLQESRWHHNNVEERQIKEILEAIDADKQLGLF
jgi:hypothetical protein